MIRGTTPTLKFDFGSAYPPSQFSSVSFVISRNNSIAIEKSLNNFTVEGTKLVLTLTQQETLGLRVGEYQYQFRICISNK